MTGKQFGRQYLPLGEYEEAKRYINRNFFFIDPENYRLSTIIERATYLVRRHGIKALVIDPYNRIEPEGDDRRSETLQISSLLDKLTRFAQTNDVLVILMASGRSKPCNPPPNPSSSKTSSPPQQPTPPATPASPTKIPMAANCFKQVAAIFI